MAEETTDGTYKATPAERALNKAVGRALWRMEGGRGATAVERKGNWTENRRKFMSQARKLLRGLEREGVTLTGPEPKDDD